MNKGLIRKKLLLLQDMCYRHHDFCEDSWYSCPKAEGGCANEDYEEDECNCGADRHNKILDDTIGEVLDLLKEME